ncbi:LysR family transcriptional regulator [Streptomyces sp. NPDC048604]|uniref:LysR family transcriptional regulator n=1 Tax=Streptomyces sp. NPDC048604 TaxID=3365578 RepID=UPI00371DD088
MELRRLQYFVTVVEEGGFTRAAARLHLSQPGLSAQIRQLERDLGQPLLDRSGRTVTPTEVGRAVLPYARAALAAVAGARQAVDEYTGLLRGRVTLGIVSGVAGHAFELPALLAEFRDAHPGVEVSLTEDSSERMRAALLSGELDLALLGTADAEPPPGLAYRVVVDEPLVAAVRDGDPLAGRDEVALAELADRALICLPRGTGVRTVLERACAQAGFAPRVAFEAAAPQLVQQLAVRGLGVAVLPWGGEPAPAGLRVLPLVRPALRGRIALAHRDGGPAGPAARAFLARLRAELPDARPGVDA